MGHHSLAQGHHHHEKEELKGGNFRNVAKGIGAKWLKKFKELMAIEEDMKAFFPQRLKEPFSALSISQFDSILDE